MNTRCAHLQIQGLVQGVSYRASARDEAHRLALRGQIRNLRNGEVEAIVEGTPDAVAAFITWCQHGPDEARVSRVVTNEQPATGQFTSFEVVR